MSLLVHIAGARPNFMKIAPVLQALQQTHGLRQLLIHTGQHYDHQMSEIFFRQLELPKPDINLEVGSGNHGWQTGTIMVRLERALIDVRPDMVLVYGDVNSTVAAALVCSKLGILLGHVEAGLRAFDRSMPEEINRVLTDQLADLLFTSSEECEANLNREGVDSTKIYYVGNVMIDTLVSFLPKLDYPSRIALWSVWRGRRSALSLRSFPEKYGVVTLHRPSNVDHPERVSSILETLEEVSRQVPLFFPIHPRSQQKLESAAAREPGPKFHLIEPLGYMGFLSLVKQSSFVITDSGGLQEETSYLNIPCLTLRPNTERPVTVTLGTNKLINNDLSVLPGEVHKILTGRGKTGRVPQLWDGRSGERIAEILHKILALTSLSR